jgi:uroporphyrinogen-III decarboxylase
MEEARAKTDRCFCGGLSHKHTLPNGTEEELRAQVQDTWKHNDGKAVIFAPGCVVNPNTSDERLLLVKKLIEETAR